MVGNGLSGSLCKALTAHLMDFRMSTLNEKWRIYLCSCFPIIFKRRFFYVIMVKKCITVQKVSIFELVFFYFNGLICSSI